ncbi:MAG: DUF3035 domain-containing protein [Yoonia sp.]|nr:DUF3035 domain-containing protein [Yoonia sp.]
MQKAILAIFGALALAACSAGERPLHDMRSSTGGPDEFSVMPVAALELPDTFTLPTPTPGASNRTDADPKGDAIAALGGNRAARSAGGIPAADAALVARAGRNGVIPNIRATLAAEDAQFRQTRKRFSLFGGVLSRNRYFKAYAAQALDAYAELQRFRNLGIATPTAPPAQ